MSVAVVDYKNAGALALGIFWLAVLFMVRLRKGVKAGSISEHAASARNVAVLFGSVSLLSAILLVLFFVNWFTPAFHLGLAFNWVVVSMLLLFAVAGLVPDTKGAGHKVHVGAAVMASLLLLPAMVMVVINDHVSQAARIFTVPALLVMLYAGCMFVSGRRTRRQVVLYEAVYFLCFDVSVLVATYVS